MGATVCLLQLKLVVTFRARLNLPCSKAAVCYVLIMSKLAKLFDCRLSLSLHTSTAFFHVTSGYEFQ